MGSEQGPCCVATSAESSRELNGPKTPRRARAREGCSWGRRLGSERRMEWAKVTGADELLSATQGLCMSLCRAAAAAATVSSSWSLVVGDGKRCILSCALTFFFFRQMVRGETRMHRWNGDWGGQEKGGLPEIYKKNPHSHPQPAYLYAWGKLGVRGLQWKQFFIQFMDFENFVLLYCLLCQS